MRPNVLIQHTATKPISCQGAGSHVQPLREITEILGPTDHSQHPLFYSASLTA